MTDALIAAFATGSNPANWTTLASLLAGSAAGNADITLRTWQWSYEPYSSYSKLGNGHDKGRGYPVARWIFKGLRIEQRENLRDFCTGVSAAVYLRTPTNETAAGARTWDDFLGILHWAQRAELASDGLNMVEMVELTFTHLEAV